MNPEELAFWAELESLVKPVVEPEIEYRIFYNDADEITGLSMSDHPDLGQYLVVDKTVYDNYTQYQIKNGMLVKIAYDAGYHVQLAKSTTGFAVVQGHAGLVVEKDEQYPNIEHYDRTIKNN